MSASRTYAIRLESGQTYGIVITTHGGLYRYDIGDRVTCVGVDGPLPRLRFVGRKGVYSDFVGEKIDEGFAASVIERLRIVATLVARTGDLKQGVRPYYELWLNDHSRDHQTIAAKAERLMSENPQYAYARSIGRLDHAFGTLQDKSRRATQSQSDDVRSAAWRHQTRELDLC